MTHAEILASTISIPREDVMTLDPIAPTAHPYVGLRATLDGFGGLIVGVAPDPAGSLRVTLLLDHGGHAGAPLTSVDLDDEDEARRRVVAWAQPRRLIVGR